MKKIAVFSGTRADFGLLYWLIKEIEIDIDLNLQLIVSGSHLSPEYGLTINDIKAENIKISEAIEMLISSNTPIGTVKSLGLGIISFSDTIKRLEPDLMIILGDRYEALAMAQVSMLFRVPILHIHGGDITIGAYDDSIRHAITKFSSVHCAATEESRNRIIQLGEDKRYVFNLGAPGLEYIKRVNFLSTTELSRKFNFDFNKPYFLVTYHPETLSSFENISAIEIILESLEYFNEFNIVITYPNVDDGNHEIIKKISDFKSKYKDNVFLIKSFGHVNYLSIMKESELIIGNSSSGIIEAPSMFVPTINIGIRQKGRTAARSIINCNPEYKDIIKAIKKGLNTKFKNSKNIFENPYGEGFFSKKIIKLIKTITPPKLKIFVDLKNK